MKTFRIFAILSSYVGISHFPPTFYCALYQASMGPRKLSKLEFKNVEKDVCTL